MGALLLAVMLTAGTPVDDAIYQASVEFGVPHGDLADLARCEAGPWLDRLVGDGGAARGIFHFHERTFVANARLIGIIGDRRDDPYASARVAASKIAREGWWAWENCARKIGVWE